MLRHGALAPPALEACCGWYAVSPGRRPAVPVAAPCKRVTDGLTHQELASMVGSSREMVSRILRDLKAGGYISTGDKRITIERDLPPGW